MVSKAQALRRVEVEKYDYTNEIMNRILGDETVWIVQGSAGRQPIIADTAEEALDDYFEKNYNKFEEENDFEQDVVE